jgi:hypothetical protein
MAQIRWLLLILFTAVVPASAADVAYPPGSHVGLAPPPGMQLSSDFPGFEDRDKKVALLLAALPPAAFAEIEKSDSAESLKKQGATLEKREELTLPIGKALLVIGSGTVENTPLHTWLLVVQQPQLTILATMRVPDAARDAYPDTVVHATLESLAVRADVPVDEQLGLLPFKVGDLAGFSIGAVLPGRGIILTDATKDSGDKAASMPHIVVALAPGAPADNNARNDFAREVFGSIPNLKDVQITGAEPQRIGGQPGHEIMAKAKDPGTGSDINIVQWLRFGAGGYLQVVGIASAPDWTQAYARFRSVRDGIGPK